MLDYRNLVFESMSSPLPVFKLLRIKALCTHWCGWKWWAQILATTYQRLADPCLVLRFTARSNTVSEELMKLRGARVGVL